jgi:hypothetical protein
VGRFRPKDTTYWLSPARWHTVWPAHGVAWHSASGRRSTRPAWPGRHGWRGELKGALGVAPDKEIGAVAHPSGRSTWRRRHSARWWQSSVVSGVGGDGVLVRWAGELLRDLLQLGVEGGGVEGV